MPAGLDVAIGARAASASPPAPGSSLGNAVDGDGTSAWCSRTLGPQSVTVDLGKATDITGTRLTFSGQLAGGQASYTVATGLGRGDSTPFPHQAAVPASLRG